MSRRKSMTMNADQLIGEEQRGKVVDRCATRIEKGREDCKESPTIEEEWIKWRLVEEFVEGSIMKRVLGRK